MPAIVPRWALWLLHPWFVLIGVSVLTTYQHHFIDIPTGALLGFFCLWLWPDRGPSPIAAFALTRDPRRRRLAVRYAAGALVVRRRWRCWPAAPAGGCSGRRSRSRWWRRTTPCFGAGRIPERRGRSHEPRGARCCSRPISSAPGSTRASGRATSRRRRRSPTAWRSAACPSRARCRGVCVDRRPLRRAAARCTSTAAGTRSRRSIWWRRSRPPCATRPPPSNGRAQAARCWSAARSAIRAAPRRSRPGCSSRARRRACRMRSSACAACGRGSCSARTRCRRSSSAARGNRMSSGAGSTRMLEAATRAAATGPRSSIVCRGCSRSRRWSC